MNKDLNYKKNLLWNLCAALVNASEAVVVIMIASRFNDREEAGILTIAFSIGNLLMMLGKYGIKNYQVSHDGYDVEFESFLKLRIITVILMITSLLGYLVANVSLGSYSGKKSVIILGVCIWYVIEAFEDVFIVHLQSLGKLYIGNRIFIIRWFVIISGFVVVDIITHKLISALLVSDALALIAEIICIYYITVRYGIKGFDKTIKIRKLIIENLPLCISEISFFYMTNVSKYVIDRKMDDTSQAIYGYIAMPVFVISLLNSIIYQPKLMGFVSDIRERRFDILVKKIIMQVVMIGAILLVCLAGAYLLGVQVLSWLYNIDLTEQKGLLLLLLSGGAALAVGGFLETMLVLMEKRKTVMTVYLSVCVFATAITIPLVEKFALKGAVWGYIATMLLMTIVFIILLVINLKRMKAKELTIEN